MTDFKMGDRVVIVSHTEISKMNGLKGIIVSIDADAYHYPIEVRLDEVNDYAKLCNEVGAGSVPLAVKELELENE